MFNLALAAALFFAVGDHEPIVSKPYKIIKIEQEIPEQTMSVKSIVRWKPSSDKIDYRVLDNGATVFAVAPPGSYYFDIEITTVTVDWDNKNLDFTLDTHHVAITIGNDPTPPGPGPGPGPDPGPNLNERATAIKAATTAVTDTKKAETIVGLIGVYTDVATRIRSGELQGVLGISAALREGTDVVLAGSGSAAAWRPIRDIVSNYLTTMAQDGAADAEYAELCDDVVAGMKASPQRS